MIIGFTGSRNGMTDAQLRNVMHIVVALNMTEARHGDCRGSDSQFARFANDVLPAHKVIVHPPIKDIDRAFEIRPGNVVREPKTYLYRNRDIVDESEIVIGCPPSNDWLNHGGTFFSLRYSIKRKKPTIICWPNGSMSAENCSASEISDAICSRLARVQPADGITN